MEDIYTYQDAYIMIYILIYTHISTIWYTYKQKAVHVVRSGDGIYFARYFLWTCWLGSILLKYIVQYTPNISPQQIKMITFGPSVMNEILVICQISFLHEIRL